MYLRRTFPICSILSLLLCLSVIGYSKDLQSAGDSLSWNNIVKKEYTLHYTSGDNDKIKNIDSYLQSGIDHISGFFQGFPHKFDVYIFPNRASLDKQWQKDWGDSTFQSQCWMIASGVANRLDILSPSVWPAEACDHSADDSVEIRRLVWHELAHVFHGQYNPDHTFSYIEKLDWLVEGLATYVSGQLDENRLQRIRTLIKQNKTPATLDEFWKGQEKYGLSGSMVAYIDKKYGRKTLFDLLTQTRKDAALKHLGISETKLLAAWKQSFQLP